MRNNWRDRQAFLSEFGDALPKAIDKTISDKLEESDKERQKIVAEMEEQKDSYELLIKKMKSAREKEKEELEAAVSQLEEEIKKQRDVSLPDTDPPSALSIIWL